MNHLQTQYAALLNYMLDCVSLTIQAILIQTYQLLPNHDLLIYKFKPLLEIVNHILGVRIFANGASLTKVGSMGISSIIPNPPGT